MIARCTSTVVVGLGRGTVVGVGSSMLGVGAKASGGAVGVDAVSVQAASRARRATSEMVLGRDAI
jgi:hypothetical protein